MSEAEFLGMFVFAVVVLVGLCASIIKPITENTKAMTELNAGIEELTKEVKEQKEELESHIEDFEKYKDKVRDSQKRQWDRIDEQGKMIQRHDWMLGGTKKGGGEDV